MSTWRRYSVFAMTTVAIVVAPGCAGSSPIDTLGNQEVATGAVVGGVIGAGLGVLAGGNDFRNAAVGALAGAATGAVATSLAADHRRKYASDKEYYDTEIAKAEKVAAEKRVELDALKSEIARRDGAMAELKRRVAAGENVREDAAREIAALNKAIERNNAISQKYADAIEYIDEMLKLEPGTSEDMGAQRKALLARRGELHAQYEELHGLNMTMSTQGADLADLAAKEDSK